ncbi:MAG: hypothetical protein JO170_10070 [Verrucomicrobia bacterium]|nr:hypothetical protein [Verrucomicrobiota bacterium]
MSKAIEEPLQREPSLQALGINALFPEVWTPVAGEFMLESPPAITAAILMTVVSDLRREAAA